MVIDLYAIKEMELLVILSILELLIKPSYYWVPDYNYEPSTSSFKVITLIGEYGGTSKQYWL